MEGHGFSPDLPVYDVDGLGVGKFFVSPALARLVLEPLRREGRRTKASEVIVSRAVESKVLDAAFHVPGARPNSVRDEELLDLSRLTLLWYSSDDLHLCSEDALVVTIERTFLQLRLDVQPDARSTATCSTTQAQNFRRNHRMMVSRVVWQ